MGKGAGCLLLALLGGLAPAPAWAWGATGHRLIGRVALSALPAGLPAFIKTPSSVWAIGEAAREPDRWKESGTTHDTELNAGHFINIDDAGKIQGVLPLEALPATREQYDTALRQGGVTQYQAGTLAYSIIIGFEQLRTDLAYWRANSAGIKFAKSAAARNWFAADRHLREQLTLRDLGVWAHFIGDASQPMHVSVHHDGWGDTANPEHLTAAKGIHGRFEGVFVRANIGEADVAAHLAPPRLCACAIEDETKAYLARSLAQLLPVYRLDKQGAFNTAKGKEFAVARLAAGASELRDLTAEAWRQSAAVKIGYPAIAVSDAEAGRADIMSALRGLD